MTVDSLLSFPLSFRHVKIGLWKYYIRKKKCGVTQSTVCLETFVLARLLLSAIF